MKTKFCQPKTWLPKVVQKQKCILFLFILMASFILVTCAEPEQENTGNTPSSGEDSYTANPKPPRDPYPRFRGQDYRGNKNFASLINSFRKGRLEVTPWAGTFWPYILNGIAMPVIPNLTMTGLTSGLVPESGTSPAGKYDAARGRKTRAQDWEITYHGKKVSGVEGWWGHCNGWAAASVLFPEPKEPVKVNGVVFGVADIKGLLTEIGMSVLADFYGERMYDTDSYSSPKYFDTVPDQYFLVLTNYMGNLKKPILVDRFTGPQVWNQPLVAYEFQYPKPEDYLGNTLQAPNVYRIRVTSKIWWVNDLGVQPDAITEPFDFSNPDANPYVMSRDLYMEVWVDAPIKFDATGKITSSGDVIVTRQGSTLVGGAWHMDNVDENERWPDYMWIPYDITAPSDPEQEYINPQVDYQWVKKHLLVPGGQDDPTAVPSPVASAPPVSPIPRPTIISSSPGNPEGRPGLPGSSATPVPVPTPTSQPGSPIPNPTPLPNPNPSPRPII